MTSTDEILTGSKNDASLLSCKNTKKYNFNWKIQNLNFYSEFFGTTLESPAFEMDKGSLILTWQTVEPSEFNPADQFYFMDEELFGAPIIKHIEIKAVLNIQYESSIIFRLSVIDGHNKKIIKDFTELEKSFLVNNGDGKVAYNNPTITTNLGSSIMDKLRDIKNNTLIISCCIEIAAKDDIHKEIDYLPPPNELYSPADNTKLLEDKKFSDIKLIVSGKEILAHKCILAANSKVFETMFDSDMKEKQENVVNIEDIDYTEFKLAMEYMYGKKIEAPTKTLLPLFVVAHKYEINGLSEYCEIQLYNMIDSKNAKEMFGIAEKYNLKNLEKRAIETMYANLKF